VEVRDLLDTPLQEAADARRVLSAEAAGLAAPAETGASIQHRFPR